MANIERHDKFSHKRRLDICIVNFVSIDGTVNYRVKGKRHCRYSTEKNFLKNWVKLDDVPDRTDSTEG